MAFIPIDVVESFSEFDNLFQLVEKSRKERGSYTPYIWKTPKSHFFRRCDYAKIFPLSLNLYLKTCTDEELSDLLNKEHFLRVHMYYDNEECSVSCIAVSNLTIADLHDPKYKELLLSCPKHMVPCEINMGPMWHYLGANRMMCKTRRIHLGWTLYSPGQFPPVETRMGFVLYGRDAYPTEDTEETIKKHEEIEEIFIIRK